MTTHDDFQARLKKALEETMTSIQSVTAVAAAGRPVPAEFVLLVISLNSACIDCLAVVEGATPRSILESWFAKVPSDEDWRGELLGQRAAKGNELLLGELDHPEEG